VKEGGSRRNVRGGDQDRAAFSKAINQNMIRRGLTILSVREKITHDVNLGGADRCRATLCKGVRLRKGIKFRGEVRAEDGSSRGLLVHKNRQ